MERWCRWVCRARQGRVRGEGVDGGAIRIAKNIRRALPLRGAKVQSGAATYVGRVRDGKARRMSRRTALGSDGWGWRQGDGGRKRGVGWQGTAVMLLAG